ncbi:Oxygen-independent coproporphyrinogen-III oxidase [Rhodospirillaceae bacterium LM-1]|nr:Oxygen-independent coproporphyrinogen-III oxidase [Rhodospirillaceae bacterium LM-1]
MRQEWLDKYDLRLPRYTSYPTAPHFHAGVNAATYEGWLADLPADLPLSLYLHIAYCAEMCWFCGCHTKITQRYEPVADYLSVLFAEVEMVAARLGRKRKARHIHFGGGSPTILTPEDLSRTIDLMRKHFDVVADAEIAVELDPRTADEPYIKAMAKAGVTRASIGVQDFDEKVQRAINRIQPYEVSLRVIDWLRASGIQDINVDLVYGLPHQTEASVIDLVERAADLRPKRVALFGYAHVPWMKKHQRLIDEATLPDVPERWRQYLSATKRLVELGFVAVGLDHFAAPDDELAIALRERRLFRNFQGYTTDSASALIGFGASSIGALPQGYVGNEGSIDAYKRVIREGKLAVTRGVAVSDEDKLRRAVIERLMCDLSVDLDETARRFGQSPDYFSSELAKLKPLAEDGICAISGHVIAVTEEGRPLVRAVCAVFDTYLKAGEQRHAKAV